MLTETKRKSLGSKIQRPCARIPDNTLPSWMLGSNCGSSYLVQWGPVVYLVQVVYRGPVQTPWPSSNATSSDNLFLRNDPLDLDPNSAILLWKDRLRSFTKRAYLNLQTSPRGGLCLPGLAHGGECALQPTFVGRGKTTLRGWNFAVCGLTH
jgi:hypothetical protein